MRKAVLVGLTMVGFIGCSLSTDNPSRRVVVSTDRVDYTPVYLSGEGTKKQYGFSVITRTVNTSAATVFLARCFPDDPQPMYGVEAPDSKDGSAYDHPWGCVGHDKQIELKPNVQRTDTIFLSGPNVFPSTGLPDGAMQGRMRIRFLVQSCKGDGACLLSSDGISNEFSVLPPA